MPERPARCRSCGAPIRFVRTVHGHTHPLDWDPVPHGEWTLTTDPKGAEVMLRATHLTSKEADLYTSHFATCPDADQHRRKR